MIYTSSDGTKKEISSMHYEYLANALSKLLREIFNSKSLEEYNQKLETIVALENEIQVRIDSFMVKNIEEGTWK